MGMLVCRLYPLTIVSLAPSHLQDLGTTYSCVGVWQVSSSLRKQLVIVFSVMGDIHVAHDHRHDSFTGSLRSQCSAGRPLSIPNVDMQLIVCFPLQNDRVEIIANDQGNRTTPSYVAFTDAERLVGDAAKNQAAMNPMNTVFDAKRLIGRKFDDPVVQADAKLW